MVRRSFWVGSLLLLTACASASPPAAVAGASRAAEAPPATLASPTFQPPPAADVVRAYRRPTRDPESDVDTGGAIVRIPVPIDVVFATATDFARYHRVLPGVDKSIVLGRDGADVDVYLSIPVLDGAATAWAVIRFHPLAAPSGAHAFEGRLVRGNLDDLRIRCAMRPDGPSATIVELELYGDPRLPIPANALAEELQESARVSLEILEEQAILAARRAERAAQATPGVHVERQLDD